MNPSRNNLFYAVDQAVRFFCDSPGYYCDNYRLLDINFRTNTLTVSVNYFSALAPNVSNRLFFFSKVSALSSEPPREFAILQRHAHLSILRHSALIARHSAC